MEWVISFPAFEMEDTYIGGIDKGAAFVDGGLDYFQAFFVTDPIPVEGTESLFIISGTINESWPNSTHHGPKTQRSYMRV